MLIDDRSLTQSRNTRSYTLRSVPSSTGRSFFDLAGGKFAYKEYTSKNYTLEKELSMTII